MVNSKKPYRRKKYFPKTGWHYLHIKKHLDDKSLKITLRLFNESWIEGKAPSSWQQALVAPIHKPDKKANLPQSYRPIALICHLSKIMETMVAQRLKWYLAKMDTLDSDQSAFRSGSYTLDHILQLHDHISKSISNRRTAVEVVLDIENAYDMVWFKGFFFGWEGKGRCLWGF